MKVIGIAGAAGAGKDEVAKILAGSLGFQRIALADPMKRFAAIVFRFSQLQLWGPSLHRNATDYRFDGSGTMPSNEWRFALSRLEARGPEWLDSLGIHALDMAPLRVWFFGLMFEAHGLTYPACNRIDPQPLSARRALQTLGTEFGRAVDEGVWVRKAMHDAARLLEGGRAYVPSLGVHPAPDDRPTPAGVAISDVRYPNEAAAIRERGAVILVDRPGAGLQGRDAAHTSETSFTREMADGYIPNDGSLEHLAWLARNVATFLLEGKLCEDHKEPPAPPAADTTEAA